MKRNLLFMSMLATLFLAGCSQDDFSLDPGENGNGETTTGYLAVNLVSSDATRSRATGNGYLDGSDTENQVDKVRFYFFNGGGGNADVRILPNGNYVNYLDWDNPGTDDNSPSGDVEKILTAKLVINTKKGDRLPVRIAAVLNPTSDIVNTTSSQTMSQLRDISANYATATLTVAGKFVMFNSTHLEGGNAYSSTDITADKIYKSDEDAIKNPVEIYVERSVAKVSVVLGSNVADAAKENGKIALKNNVENGQNLTVGGKQVYLKLSGWALAAETDKGRLVKKINPLWDGSWWKDNGNNTGKRTFWAINEKSAINLYSKSYTTISTSFGEDNYLYTNENAQLNDIDGTQGNAQKNTKFIVKGQLVDENDKPFTIVRHMGSHFADNPENFNELKKSILAMLENKEYFYYYKEGTEYKQITADDIVVVAPTTTPTEDSGNCYVYTQLSTTGAAKTWYKSIVKNPTSTDQYEQIVKQEGEEHEINKILKDKNPATNEYFIDRPLVWNSGMTYYYNEIKHLQGCSDPSVVRNHVYKITIANIAGFGTPVYNPGDIIYPEKPEENDHYIAAKINILSWRVVNNSYNLDW